MIKPRSIPEVLLGDTFELKIALQKEQEYESRMEEARLNWEKAKRQAEIEKRRYEQSRIKWEDAKKERKAIEARIEAVERKKIKTEIKRKEAELNALKHKLLKSYEDKAERGREHKAAEAKKKAEAEKKRKAEEALKKAEAEKKCKEAKALKDKLHGGFKKKKGTRGSSTGYSNSNNIGDGGKGKGSRGADLKGRRAVSKPATPKNPTQKLGVVVIKICVDRRGNVTSATYTQRGSTLNDSKAIQTAIKDAKKWKFNPASNGLDEQCGSIRYTFDVN